MNFERNTDIYTQLGIGRETHQIIRMLDKIAKRNGVEPAKIGERINNPEIVAQWTGKGGSYAYLVIHSRPDNISSKYLNFSLTFDAGGLNFAGRMDVEQWLVDKHWKEIAGDE